jgi:hypothetical protein
VPKAEFGQWRTLTSLNKASGESSNLTPQIGRRVNLRSGKLYML